MELLKANRREWTWTDHQERQAALVEIVVNELREYWPLTLRQVYYRLVAAGHLENKRSKYNGLSKLVKHMRLDRRIGWNTITDRSRRLIGGDGWDDYRQFTDASVYHFLRGYKRNRSQGQPCAVEVWTEKDALAGIFERAVRPYCIPAVVCRGYQSITFIKDFQRRASQAQENGQRPVILYFGDLDPSGVQMLEATVQTVEDEMHLDGVRFDRIALTPEHIDEFNLPHDPSAVKMTDARYGGYIRRFGHLAVELDALHPGTLTNMTRLAVERHFDMDVYEEQCQIEREEIETLARLKADVASHLEALLGQED